jgi:excisionase family DNA binding protein
MSRQAVRSSARAQPLASAPGHEAAQLPATLTPGEEILTYPEAAQLLKVSARTMERWTREALIPYIRLPERGAWSGVRFSRSQLLRWLRQRTVKER